MDRAPINRQIYPFSLIFFLFGFDILPLNDNKMFLRKTIQYLMKVLIIFSIINTIYYSVNDFTHLKPYINLKERLFRISVFIKLFIFSMSFICFELKLKKIKNLIMNITNELNKSHSINYFSKILLLIWSLFILFNILGLTLIHTFLRLDIFLIISDLLWAFQMVG